MRLNIYKYMYSILISPGLFFYIGSPSEWKEWVFFQRSSPFIFALYVEGHLKKSS